MKQFELSAWGLNEMEAKEQIETTGGEIIAILSLILAGVVLAVDIYDNWDRVKEGWQEGAEAGYAAGRN